MIRRGDKKGLSQVIAIILVILLAIVAVGIVGSLTFSLIKKNTEKFTIQSELLKEKFQMTKVLVNPNNSSQINITFCCASSSKSVKKESTIINEEKQLDISLVIDRSNSASA